MKNLPILLILLSSCGTRITDAYRANLVSYEKQKHSSYYVVTIMPEDSCIQYVFYHNSNKWHGKDAVIPTKWNVVIKRNGKSYSTPVK